MAEKLALPYKREYMKRGPAPETGLLDIPGVAEAIKDYLKPEAFLERGLYPVGTPPEKQDIDTPTLSIGFGRLNKRLAKIFKDREDWVRALRMRDAFTEGKMPGNLGELLGVEDIKASTRSALAFPGRVPKRFVKSLKDVQSSMTIPSMGLYNQDKRLIKLKPSGMAERDLYDVFRHELGHHAFYDVAKPKYGMTPSGLAGLQKVKNALWGRFVGAKIAGAATKDPWGQKAYEELGKHIYMNMPTESQAIFLEEATKYPGIDFGEALIKSIDKAREVTAAYPGNLKDIDKLASDVARAYGPVDVSMDDLEDIARKFGLFSVKKK